MNPLALALAGMGVGTLKHFAVDKPAADRQRKLAAATTRYSPWTKLIAQMPEEPNVFNSALQGGMSGFSMGQNMERHDAMMGRNQEPQSAFTPGGWAPIARQRMHHIPME